MMDAGADGPACVAGVGPGFTVSTNSPAKHATQRSVRAGQLQRQTDVVSCHVMSLSALRRKSLPQTIVAICVSEMTRLFGDTTDTTDTTLLEVKAHGFP
jgi:hypothetical protein